MARFISLIFCLYCFSTALYSQVGYDFESGFPEWIQKPVSSWELTKTSAISGTYSLMHSEKTVAGKDTIFLPVSGITFAGHDVTWKFLLRYNYNPAPTNRWAVILAANDTSANYNGYAVGVNANTNDDILCLYRINNGVYTEILKTNINLGTSKTALEIRRNQNDYWHIGTGNDFSSISFYSDSISDTGYSDISYFSILHIFTSSASKVLFVDDISINAVDRIEKEPDTEIIPPNTQIAGASISSVSKDTIEVFRFDIQDVDVTDAFPTYLRQVTIKDAKPPSSANWGKTIKNAYLYADNLLITSNTTINDSIVFHFNHDLLIPSGSSSGLSMKIMINDSLTDNSALKFKIDKNNHGFSSSTDGSGMVAAITNDILSGVFAVTVDADTIRWR
ncbi:MAG: hypothetical protein LBT50_04575, partial [Prevotellaceae bacterium]|nr:hypothetical protein [Prevotellaceae bacterium]